MAKYRREQPKFRMQAKNIGRFVAWVEVDNHGTLWVMWNYPNGEKYTQRSHWMNTESKEKHLYSTLTQWDELSLVLSSLGVGLAGSSAYGVEWSEGDTDVFRTDVYDFSPILKGVTL